MIGNWYARGWGGEEKTNQAIQWLKKAVLKRNTQAMYNLGVAYHHGYVGLTQSDTKANELWALVAEKGHAKARYHLGHGYRNGEGDLAIDFKRCVKLWEQSAKQGDIDAQASLGNMYLLGSRDGPPMTIPVDPQLCFRWMLAAAKQGHVIAMNNIGHAYQFGTGVEQDDESAFEWYKKVAETGDEDAQFIRRKFKKIVVT